MECFVNGLINDCSSGADSPTVPVLATIWIYLIFAFLLVFQLVSYSASGFVYFFMSLWYSFWTVKQCPTSLSILSFLENFGAQTTYAALTFPFECYANYSSSYLVLRQIPFQTFSQTLSPRRCSEIISHCLWETGKSVFCVCSLNLCLNYIRTVCSFLFCYNVKPDSWETLTKKENLFS